MTLAIPAEQRGLAPAQQWSIGSSQTAVPTALSDQITTMVRLFAALEQVATDPWSCRPRPSLPRRTTTRPCRRRAATGRLPRRASRRCSTPRASLAPTSFVWYHADRNQVWCCYMNGRVVRRTKWLQHGAADTPTTAGPGYPDTTKGRVRTVAEMLRLVPHTDTEVKVAAVLVRLFAQLPVLSAVPADTVIRVALHATEFDRSALALPNKAIFRDLAALLDALAARRRRQPGRPGHAERHCQVHCVRPRARAAPGCRRPVGAARTHRLTKNVQLEQATQDRSAVGRALNMVDSLRLENAELRQVARCQRHTEVLRDQTDQATGRHRGACARRSRHSRAPRPSCAARDAARPGHAPVRPAPRQGAPRADVDWRPQAARRDSTESIESASSAASDPIAHPSAGPADSPTTSLSFSARPTSARWRYSSAPCRPPCRPPVPTPPCRPPVPTPRADPAVASAAGLNRVTSAGWPTGT